MISDKDRTSECVCLTAIDRVSSKRVYIYNIDMYTDNR